MEERWVQRSNFGTPWGTTREIYTSVSKSPVYDALIGQLSRFEEGDQLVVPIRHGRLAGAQVELTLRPDIGTSAFLIRQRGRILAFSCVVWKPEGLLQAFATVEETYLKVTDHGAFVTPDSAKMVAPTSVPWVGELLTASLTVYSEIFNSADPSREEFTAWLGEIMEALPSVGNAVLDAHASGLIGE